MHPGLHIHQLVQFSSDLFQIAQADHRRIAHPQQMPGKKVIVSTQLGQSPAQQYAMLTEYPEIGFVRSENPVQERFLAFQKLPVGLFQGLLLLVTEPRGKFLR